VLISRLAKSDTSDTNWRLFGAEAAAWTDAWTMASDRLSWLLNSAGPPARLTSAASPAPRIGDNTAEAATSAMDGAP